MAFSLSIVFGLFVLAFGVSRVRTKRGAKQDVQTLFGRK